MRHVDQADPLRRAYRRGTKYGALCNSIKREAETLTTGRFVNAFERPTTDFRASHDMKKIQTTSCFMGVLMGVLCPKEKTLWL